MIMVIKNVSITCVFACLLLSYFEHMDRILDESYVPDEQDVLRSRVQTTGIVETSFRVKQMTYRSVSVHTIFV